ncbi:ATP-dependent zinc protease [Ilumatobacter sp.]|uniref:ATP-dependent zinc protease family protein n=1 Tax=Ilumatobacter sp. TaxID=1967498 RepID=UPI003C604605
MPVPVPSSRPSDAATPSLIGWREWVAFPEWGVAAMKAKTDTGARTSALHATDIEEFERDGVRWARFVMHPWQRNDDDPHPVEAPCVDQRAVTSSSGTRSVRPVISAVIDLDGSPHDIELTLTRRDEMGFRMLLGRNAMAGRYIIDPSLSYVTGRPDRETRQRNRGRR